MARGSDAARGSDELQVGWIQIVERAGSLQAKF